MLRTILAKTPVAASWGALRVRMSTATTGAQVLPLSDMDFRDAQATVQQDLANLLQDNRLSEFDSLPIAFIRATQNNTFVTVTTAGGDPIYQTSAGVCGFRNAKRGTQFAGQSAGMKAAQKCTIEKGFDKVRVKVAGVGQGRANAVKGLQMGGFQIVSLSDVTPKPHNGCRAPKKRRL